MKKYNRKEFFEWLNSLPGDNPITSKSGQCPIAAYIGIKSSVVAYDNDPILANYIDDILIERYDSILADWSKLTPNDILNRLKLTKFLNRLKEK